jgi:DNA-binding NarL/FixJ family response regulator
VAVRILLVDDHKIMRDGLRSLLEKEADFEIVAEAEDGKAAVRMARDEEPDVVIMDVAMPDMNGIDATTRIRASLPNVKIVALTMHSDKNYLTGMLRAGTAGYLLKDCAAEELVKAVRDVVAGKAYISPEIAPMILEDYSGRSPTSKKESDLTDKETEVLQLFAEGLGAREIAEKLKVSSKTVERTRTVIMEKLKLYSVAELTKYAIRKGITPLS